MAPHASAVLAGIAAFGISHVDACTMVAVGKDASATGHPIIAHTDDSGGTATDVRFIRVPRKQWPAGSMRPLYHWVSGYPRVVSSVLSLEYAPVGDQKETVPIGYIPQVAETYAYWDMDYGVQNEWGLSIGESTSTARTIGWPASPDKPYGYCRAGIEDLSKIALERCKTARCAVQVMGDIAVEQGFYSADSGKPDAPDYSDGSEALTVGDSEEAWIFNVLTGDNNASAIWAAWRIPDDHVAAIGNSFTIRRMDLNDPENYLYSPGITKLAEKKGWWSPEDDEPGFFDFFGVYGFQPEVNSANTTLRAQQEGKANMNAFYSGRRMWRIFSLLSPAEGAKLDPSKGNLPKTVDPYPGSVSAPKGSISAKDVMEVLRDHYEGTPYDLTQGMAAGPFGTPNRGPVPAPGSLGQWERAISMHRSSWSFIMDATPGGRSVTWLGLDSPHGTAYLPFFGSASGGAPKSFHSSEGMQSKFSTKTAWWAFNMVNQYSDLNFKLINADVREHSKAVEDEGREKVKECIAEADRIAGKDGEDAARDALTECSNKFANAKIAQWWDYGFSLLAKYSRYAITENETETGEQHQIYPAWWVTSAEVGYSLWSRTGPFHGIPDEAAKASSLAMTATNPATPLSLICLLALGGVVVFQLGVRRGVQVGKDQDDLMYVAAP